MYKGIILLLLLLLLLHSPLFLFFCFVLLSYSYFFLPFSYLFLLLGVFVFSPTFSFFISFAFALFFPLRSSFSVILTKGGLACLFCLFGFQKPPFTDSFYKTRIFICYYVMKICIFFERKPNWNFLGKLNF